MFASTPQLSGLPQSNLRFASSLGEGAFWCVQPPPESCPRLRGKWTRTYVSGRKGSDSKMSSCLTVPPQLRLRSAAPPQAVAPFGCSTSTACSAVPLRGAIVSMGLRGSPGGLRGEIEIFPGPLAKKFTLPPLAAVPSALCQDSAAQTRAFRR